MPVDCVVVVASYTYLTVNSPEIQLTTLHGSCIEWLSPNFCFASPLRGLNILMTHETLGIFGDSFADVFPNKPAWTKAWPNLLGDNYLVTNHAWSASSLEYTYKTFMLNHHHYDRIVVLATSPWRFGHDPMTLDNKPVWINSYGTLEGIHHSGKGLLSAEDNHKLEALRMYWEYLQPLSGVFLTAPLILAEIRRRRPDAIIISCFTWPYANDEFLNRHCMRDLMNASLRGIRPDYTCDEEFWAQETMPYKEENMICHMTLEGNQLMALNVREHLEQGLCQWQPQHWPQVIQSSRPWQDYISESNPKVWEHLTQLQRFVEFFSNKPRTR